MRPTQGTVVRIARAAAVAAAALVALVASVAVGVEAAFATGAPSVANGFAAYSPGSTSPSSVFDALTLVTGGASSVNTASLTIVTQPASGAATVSTDASHGYINYTPASGTTGNQTLTFAWCAPGATYPTAGSCTTATMTYQPGVTEYMGANVNNIQGVIQPLTTAVSLPPSALVGSTISASIAPVPSSVPASQGGVSVNYAAGFSVVLPIPSAFTYVPNSITVTGGDATTSGHFHATYCTAASASCTAHIASGNYKTVYPYIQTMLDSGVTVSGGSNVSIPTVSASFVASGAAGTVVPIAYTEFILTTNVQIVGSLTVDGYPSCSSCSSGLDPIYQAPAPLASTTITATDPHTVAVTGVAPNNGPEAGGTSVTITGSDLAGATAVHFGTAAATITADTASSITATSPPGTGAVDVTVTGPDGTSATSSADQFTYTNIAPPPTVTSIDTKTGPAGGGTSVTITGANLQNATAVNFGPGNPGTITADSTSSITATSPAGSGTVDITVTTPTGVSPPVAAAQYAFGTQVLTRLSTWTDPNLCGIPATTTIPTLASKVVADLAGGPGGGGGGAASSNSGGSGGAAGSLHGTFAVTGGQKISAVSGCTGATAPHGAGVVSTGGAGGAGYSNGGNGGNGFYCTFINAMSACIGTGGVDGSGGGGGGSSALCLGTSCQVGVAPVAVAGGGGGGGESMCAGTFGGGGGDGGASSSTPSLDQTGAGPSGTDGGQGGMTGNVGGTGGVNQSTGSAGGEVGGNGNPSVSLGDSAGNGGGGGGYVGGHGSHANGATDCSAGGGGGGGTSYALNGSGATYGTTRSGGAVSLAFYGFVGTAPAVTTQPTDTTVNDGQTATFSAAASGNPTPGVQWQVSADSGTTWTNILGANATTLSLPVTVADTGKQVRAVFANSIGTATTSAANLTVDVGPAVTTQPTDQLIITGQSVTFTAGATGNPAPTVQWQVSTDGGTTFADVDATAFPDVTGATSDTMTFTTADGQSGDIFQAVYTNSVSSATSSPATLTLETPPSVTTDPTSGSVIVSHGSVVFTAAGTGNPTPTIQWQVSTNGGTTWANVSGGTKASLTVAPYSLAQSGWQYHAVFTNAAGTATSAAATLTVLPIPPLVITTASLPDGVTFNKLTKKLYSATLAAQWGNQPYFWYVIAGSLPPGLKINKGTGVISGKAAMMGTYTFTVKVLDAKGPAPLHLQNSATKTFSITIGS